MKTLNILDGVSKAITLDSGTGNVAGIDYMSTNIDYAYVVPEDMKVQYTHNGETKTIDACEGDIVIKFYKRDWVKNPVIVVKNAKWKENVLQYQLELKKRELEKETWAKQHTIYSKDCECCCGC